MQPASNMLRTHSPGQGNILARALTARQRTRGSILTPFLSTKKAFQSIQRKTRRMHATLKRVRQKRRRVSELCATTTQHITTYLHGDDSMDRVSPERMLSDVTKLAHAVERLDRSMADMEAPGLSDNIARLDASLAEMGEAFITQAEAHNTTAQSWMRTQFGTDARTAVGSTVRECPGAIHYSPFTVYDAPYDHIDAKGATDTRARRAKW